MCERVTYAPFRSVYQPSGHDLVQDGGLSAQFCVFEFTQEPPPLPEQFFVVLILGRSQVELPLRCLHQRKQFLFV